MLDSATGKILSMLGTSWVCESTFSSAKFPVQTKYLNKNLASPPKARIYKEENNSHLYF